MTMPNDSTPSIAGQSESTIDVRRRILLGGLAAAIGTALLTACKQESATPTPAPAPTIDKPLKTDDLGTAAVDLNIPPGMQALSPAEMQYARNFLTANISVDVHCHPGMFFFEGTEPEDPMLQKMASMAGFQARTVGDMAAGGCSAALFATVADIRLIGAHKQGGLYAHREFKPGEAYANHLRQLVTLNNMVDSGLVIQARTAAEVVAAKQAGKTAAIFSCEGGDFLEEKIERLEGAWQAGIRSIGLVHYHVNDIGDIQTAEPVHNGLTKFGRQAVIEMNRLGMIVDLAHATYATSKAAVAASSQPVMLSHSFLADDTTQNPRLISTDHALMVAETGGIIGAWPTGIGNPDFSSFIDRLLHLVDVVGIDHVSLGTDMDANYKPVFTSYRQMPYLPAILKQRGMNDDEIIQVLGGNFMRVFAEVTQAGVYS